MKIFILEDDPPEAHFYRLRGFNEAFNGYVGHELTLAKNFEQGLEKFKPPYDLMLLDFDITEKDQHCYLDHPKTGYTFVQRIANQLSRYPNTHVIVHSWNRDGGNAMVSVLQEHGIHQAEVRLYGKTLLDYLKTLQGVKNG